MHTQQRLQGLEIGQLVKRLADLRGNELKVETSGDAATSDKEPAVANATINKRTVSYQTTYHPARVLTLLLRNWEQPVIMNGIKLATKHRQKRRNRTGCSSIGRGCRWLDSPR